MHVHDSCSTAKGNFSSSFQNNYFKLFDNDQNPPLFLMSARLEAIMKLLSGQTGKRYLETFIKIKEKYQKALTMISDGIHIYVLNKVNRSGLQRLSIFLGTSQQAFTCSKLTIETLEQGM